MRVQTHNEWDPLEEIIVGSAKQARWPIPNRDLQAMRYRGHKDINKISYGAVDPNIIAGTEEDLEHLVQTLKALSIVVHRPEYIALSKEFSTMDWRSDGMYNYCPRDVMLTIGNMIIEAPMSFRSRFLEPFAYKNLCVEYLKNGAHWISAPKPRLLDAMFNVTDPQKSALHELEPVFDAANVLKLGRDILYLVSDTGNELGYQWLKVILGDAYRVHACRNLYASSHIDTTLVPLRPGLVLVNPARVTEQNIPDFFKNWKILAAPEPVDIHFRGRPAGSAWMSMNLLMVRPDLAIVEKSQTPLIQLLEEQNMNVIALPLRHARTLGGGFHCVTLDVRRSGILEDYQ